MTINPPRQRGSMKIVMRFARWWRLYGDIVEVVAAIFGVMVLYVLAWFVWV